MLHKTDKQDSKGLFKQFSGNLLQHCFKFHHLQLCTVGYISKHPCLWHSLLHSLHETKLWVSNKISVCQHGFAQKFLQVCLVFNHLISLLVLQNNIFFYTFGILRVFIIIAELWTYLSKLQQYIFINIMFFEFTMWYRLKLRPGQMLL